MLAALVLVSTVLRAWAALGVPVPWIAPDEMVYGLLGRSLYLHGSLEILGGPTPFYSLLTPVLTGFPLSVFGLVTGYDVLQVVQAFVMSLTAVPVYLWGRSLVSRRSALVAAVLTLAVPGLVYSGLLMTEVLFYPLLVLVAWASAEAIARPSPRGQALLVIAVLAICATRIQAIVLLPVLVTAVLVDAAFARSWASLRRLWPTAAALGLFVVGWTGWRLASGAGTLGGYEVIASTSYSVSDATKFVVYHFASVLILSGLFPVAALALMVIHAVGRGEPDRRVRAYLAVALSLTLWLVVEVGIFASRYSDRIIERNLIGLAPILFLGLVLWLERGPDGRYVERAAIALVAAVVLVLLPVKRLVDVHGTQDAMTLIPLYKFSTATSPNTLTLVFSIVAAALAVAFAVLPRRRLRLMPLFLLVVFAAASVSASRFVANQARAQQRTFLGPDPRWVDHAGARRAVYLYDGEPSWPGVWETLFWNNDIDRVYDLGDVEVTGPVPQTHVTIQADGSVAGLPAGREKVSYAVVSNWVDLRGKPVVRVAQKGLTQSGLVLWKLDRPLRVSSRVFGLQPNGDIFGPTTGTLVAYGCRDGMFQMTMVVKEAGKVNVKVNGKVVRHLTYDGPTMAHLDLPARGDGGTCRLDVIPSGLLGTIVFKFVRA